MIPGLSLIGVGADSCIINTQTLVNSNGFVAVEVKDSCLFRGFQIVVYYNSGKGYGIAQSGNSIVKENKISTAWFGMYVGYTGTNLPITYKNIISGVSVGIELFNTNAIVRSNTIYTDPSSGAALIVGIWIGAFGNESPIIDSNYIVDQFYGICQELGAYPTIRNNIIIKQGGDGIHTGVGKANILNNLIIAESGYDGIWGNGTIKLVRNNYVTGNFSSYGISHVSPSDTIINNVVTNCSGGIQVWNNQNIRIRYNDIWNNETNFSGFTPDSTNISVDPMIVNDDTTQGDLDFHLQMFSPLINAGDPNILDRDGSRSDIGLYGGSYGWTYT